MNPYKLKDVFNYLTSNNQLLKRKLKLGTDDIPIPPKRDDVTTIEAINRFNKANPRVDTTNLKPLSVKHSKVKQSNVGEADEGTIQSAFDTATREAQFEGYPAPNYDKFKSRYLKKNMKADGGRIGYKDGPSLLDMIDVQASGTKSGKQQIEGAPEGITSDKETINAILTMDIPLTEKVNLIGDLQYGKYRDKIEYNDDEIFLDDPKSYRNRNIGLDYNRGGEGFSGSATVGDEGPEFNIRYKKSFADGGMLVQPSDDGSRPGYAKPIKTPTKKELEIAKKVYGSKPEFKDKKGVDLWKAIGTVNRSNIIQKKTTGGTGGIPGGITKQNMLSKDDFIKLVNANKNKTYNQFVELIKNFKTKDGKAFTKNIVADRLRSYNLSGSFKKEPPKGPDNIKKAEAEKKRKLNLKDTEPTKAKGTKKYPFHHITQIAGGVPLTSDDVAIINQRMNSVMSTYDQALNRIAESIQKNNKLALEAMNAKEENSALKYMTRVDELNSQAEKIVNSAIDKLPKKYKNLVGFTQFSLPINEYGLPIGNEPMVTKKIGGMPVSKDAIDLTTLDLKQEKEFRKIVKAQAEAGKTGKINEKSLKNLIASFGGGTCSVFSGKKANLKADGGRIGLATGTPNLDDCFKSGASVINSGKVPVDKADDFAQVLKRAGNIGRGIMKFGIIPEALYATADSLVRVGMGDTFTEAGLRATDYLLPGDQTKTAEISKVSRIFGDETGELVGRTIDYKKQLEKIQSLEDQKANFENLSDGGEFSYIGDLSSDVNNVEKQLIQARNDLDNKFKISEAEQLFAESKQDDAYDASKATSFLSNLKRKYRD